MKKIRKKFNQEVRRIGNKVFNLPLPTERFPVSGLGDLLTTEMTIPGTCSGIGAAAGALVPVAGIYAMTSNLGENPLIGAITTPILYLTGSMLTIPTSLGFGTVGGLVGADVGRYLQEQKTKMENYLKR